MGVGDLYEVEAYAKMTCIYVSNLSLQVKADFFLYNTWCETSIIAVADFA